MDEGGRAWVARNLATASCGGPFVCLSRLTGSPPRRLVPVALIPASPSSYRLLLVEDEPAIAAPVRRGLEEEGYAVTVAPDGERGLAEALAGGYDALVVDWRLPLLDGRTLIERLRAAGRTEPVLMLTALGEVERRVAGLDAGADDFLAKPFSFEELLARLRALLRRAKTGDEAGFHRVHLRVGRLHLDTAHRRAVVDDDGGKREVSLRDKELRFLEVLMRHAGETLRVSVGTWPMLERFLAAFDDVRRSFGHSEGAEGRT